MDADFRKLLAKNQCLQSMTRVDNHYDNAFAESFFSRFKAELLHNGPFLNIAHAHMAIFEYIEIYYNRIRRNTGLNYLLPEHLQQNLIFNPIKPRRSLLSIVRENQTISSQCLFHFRNIARVQRGRRGSFAGPLPLLAFI